MKTKLPTKPGPYWWRAKEGDKWRLIDVYMHSACKMLFGCFMGDYMGRSLADLVGQWSPCPNPDEVKIFYEIQITKLQYGSKVLLRANSKPQAIQDIIRHVYGSCKGEWMKDWERLQAKGYTCQKVRVFKEVEG